MKYYVINLDKRKDRFKSFKNEFSKIASIDSLVRISGIEFETDQPDLNTTRASCSAAHFTAIKAALKEKNDLFTVFEDDVFFYDYTSELIEKNLNYLKNKKWDLLYWGCVPRVDTTSIPIKKTEQDFILKLMCGGAAHAITYKRDFALEYIKLFPKDFKKSSWLSWVENNIAYDNFLMKVQTKGDCYVPHKICACQTNGYSDIDRGESDRQDVIEREFKSHYDNLS